MQKLKRTWQEITSGWMVVALLVAAGCAWLAGPGSQSVAAQTAVRIFGTLSGAAKAVAVDSTGRLRVVIEGGGAAFDQLVTITMNAIGVTSARGLTVTNTTAAAAGSQQYSPMVCQSGMGWKTDATAGSQSVEFCWEVQPVQGTAAPSGNYILKASINGGAFATVGTFSSAGAPTFTGVLNATALRISNASLYLEWAGRTLVRSPADGQTSFRNNAETNTFDITLATNHSALSGEAVSVVVDGFIYLGTTVMGQLFLNDSVDNRTCGFQVRGSSNAVDDQVALDPNGQCTAVKDSAASVNVYYDAAGGSGAGYYIQNKRTTTRNIRVVIIGVQ